MYINFCDETGTLFSGRRNGILAREKFLKKQYLGLAGENIIVTDRAGQLTTSSFIFGLLRELVCEWVSAGIVKTELDLT